MCGATKLGHEAWWWECCAVLMGAKSRVIGRYPWQFVILSIVITVAGSSGFAVLKNESRPVRTVHRKVNQ